MTRSVRREGRWRLPVTHAAAAAICVACGGSKGTAPATVIAPTVVVPAATSASPRTAAAPPPARASFVPPGPCVDVDADAARRLRGDPPSESRLSIQREPDGPDLDGDGVRDALVVAGIDVETNALLYVLRGSCGVFVGDVGGSPQVLPGAQRHHGLVDVFVTSGVCEDAPCACTSFRFDGTSYQIDESATPPPTCDRGDGP